MIIMRYHGYRDVWENCYFSCYGKDAAKRFAEKTFCLNGRRYYTHNNKLVSDQVCYDWHKCKGLHEVIKLKKFPKSFGKKPKH